MRYFWTGRNCAKCGSVPLSENVYFLMAVLLALLTIAAYKLNRKRTGKKIAKK